VIVDRIGQQLRHVVKWLATAVEVEAREVYGGEFLHHPHYTPIEYAEQLFVNGWMRLAPVGRGCQT
jgi:hypothetical protein